MKSQIKKILSVFVCVCMLASMLAITTSAASASITFDDTAKRTEFSTEQQVWEQNGIKVTNNKNESTSNVADYSNPARFYKSSSVTIEYPGMTKIEVTANSASYATALVNSISDADVSADGKVVTITLAAAADSFTVAKLSAQVRVDSITVYSDSAAGGDTSNEEENTPTVPEAGSTLTIKEAIALGESKEHNTYTSEKYYVTGVITSVYSTQYGNMYIEDEEGNSFTIYGTYSADGELRYDALEVKPAAGDTVTVYGIIGQYSGTAQMKNGWIVNHVPGEGEEEEVVPDPEADSTLTVKDAITLGESKDHNNYTANKYYVTGVITEVYSETYGNMRITDKDGNIFTVYGTYSADGELRYDALEVKPVAGDTITVYGIIGQYSGTAQMKNGWITKHVLAGEVTDTLTIEEAIALGESKEHNTYTDEKYYVTGVITSVYNEQYGNMYIEDENGNRLTIYGTYSADGELRYDAMEVKPVKGDTVTIYGRVGQYSGTAQIKNGWIVDHVPGEGDDEEEVPDPEADSTLTIEQAIALGASKDHNNYTSNKYYVTGVITEVYNEQYGNMKITDENGNILTIYGTYSADGELRYDALEVKPVVGDTVTIYGIVGQYNDVAQVKNGWITAHTAASGNESSDDVSDESTEGDTPVLGDSGFVIEMVIVMVIALAAVAVVYRTKRRA